MVDDVARANCNAIFAQVRRRADSYYLQTREVPAEDPAYAPGFDSLQYLIEKAHARGIEVHAWFVVYPSWAPTGPGPLNPDHLHYKHGPAARGADYWLQVNSNGVPQGGLDPGHPGAQAYLADVITQPLNHYDIDGIHLDYIRYFEQTGTASSGYNPMALERFRRETQTMATPAPRDAAWSDWRRKQVTQLVRQVYLRSIEKKPKVKLSAALISWGNGPLNDAGFRLSDAYATVFQDWVAWMEEGIIDMATPMHYFDDKRNAQFLDRWLAFGKARQFRRAYIPGVAPYLNDIRDSVAQTRRSLEPGADGKPVPGVAFYSYASTNRLNAQGFPVVSNAEFFRQMGSYFEGPTMPPPFEWKENPRFGHIAGTVVASGGPEWWKDGVRVRVSSDTGSDFSRVISTDGTGFFGLVDVPPDRYRIRLERGGRTLADATPQDVRAGAVTRFDFRLGVEDFDAVIPRLRGMGAGKAAPGGVIALDGANLSLGDAFSMNVPLPNDLAGTQVLVNGIPAPIFSVSPGRVVIQLPYLDVDRWRIQVRRAGMETEVRELEWVPALPEIVDWKRTSATAVEIYATGLGAVEPPVPAGIGADPAVVLPRVVAPVRAFLGDMELHVLSAGLAPFQPGRYQVNVEVPAGARGQIRLVVGDAAATSMIEE